MKNIWKVNREASANVKRNNFDLSFVSHSTFKFGYLYPVFKRKVYPGDSFKITSAFDLKMMPVEFPVQSRMRAHMHYFYVKNKNLWDNWEDWINGLRTNSECPHPYLGRPDTDYKNGSIFDFMNIPTSIVDDSFSGRYQIYGVTSRGGLPLPRNYVYPPFVRELSGAGAMFLYPAYRSNVTDIAVFVQGYTPKVGDKIRLSDTFISSFPQDVVTSFTYMINSFVDPNAGEVSPSRFHYGLSTSLPFNTDSYIEVTQSMVDFWNGTQNPQFTLLFKIGVRESIEFDAIRFAFGQYPIVVESLQPSGFKDFSEYAEQFNPRFYEEQLLLDALPFRAYEAIYRAYYANDILQPLVINGRKEYNKFITNSGDGADSTNYHLFRRNYEYDFLTSAFPSPQAGAAPLVGINQLGEVTIEDENGITTGQAVLDSEGHVTDIVVTSPLASIEHGRTAMNIAQLGMSINDFRNANALQRLKERFLRGGFRYKPWKKAVWGVTSSDDTLDMPIFIGGYSRDVNISPIYSQANTMTADGGSNLGDWAGVGRCIGGSTHDVQHFFDDYGWVIGILCITPTPAYSQLLPKENLCPTNYLDYYFPDMAQLGMQPITYKEVAPLQSYMDSLSDSSKRLEDTFGYQRPNYDMVASVDEVHGEFRGTLRNQVINRIFDHRPELGTEFLEVNPSEINDIFINTNPDEDVFIGHVGFRIFSKRPLPRVHIPGLGF